MMTTMEIVAYIFFVALLGGSFMIGGWLSGAENKRLKSKGLVK
jgi:hypothetical protein